MQMILRCKHFQHMRAVWLEGRRSHGLSACCLLLQDCLGAVQAWLLHRSDWGVQTRPWCRQLPHEVSSVDSAAQASSSERTSSTTLDAKAALRFDSNSSGPEFSHVAQQEHWHEFVSAIDSEVHAVLAAACAPLAALHAAALALLAGGPYVPLTSWHSASSLSNG
jgi:hypothetical protein